jgi:hypothetical protein
MGMMGGINPRMGAMMGGGMSGMPMGGVSGAPPGAMGGSYGGGMGAGAPKAPGGALNPRNRGGAGIEGE